MTERGRDESRKPRLNRVAVSVASALFAGVTAHVSSQPPVRIPKAITQAEVKQFVEDRTLVKACGDGVFSFDAVQIGTTDRRTIQGRRFVLYPVHARYHVVCRYGDESMRAEVDLRTEAYLDDFGKWAMVDPGFSESQDWDHAVNGVRCRVQTIAELTVDKQDKVISSKPVSDPSYLGCTVLAKNGD